MNYKAIIAKKINKDRPHYEQCTLNMNKLKEQPGVIIENKYTAFSRFDAFTMAGKWHDNIYPVQPGTDVVGVVKYSSSPAFREGDEVVATGLGLGFKKPGGFSTYVNVPENEVLTIPVGLSMLQTAILGSAGIGAGLAIFELVKYVNSGANIAITGATCDSGAISTALFAYLGYNVTAFVPKLKTDEGYAKQLGAMDVKELDELDKLNEGSKRKKQLPLASYEGAFDHVGGLPLSNLLRQVIPSATVCTCAYDNSFSTELTPFFWRGINLSGINPFYAPLDTKLDIWRRLSGDWKIENLEWLYTEISLDEMDEHLPALLNGDTKGRIIINHSL